MAVILQRTELPNHHPLPQQHTVMDMAEFMLLQRIPTTIQWDPRQHTASEQWPVCTEEDTTASPLIELPNESLEAVL